MAYANKTGKDYAPGDEIAINIRAPYVGAGLITIERDKVYAQQASTSRRGNFRKSYATVRRAGRSSARLT